MRRITTGLKIHAVTHSLHISLLARSMLIHHQRKLRPNLSPIHVPATRAGARYA